MGEKVNMKKAIRTFVVATSMTGRRFAWPFSADMDGNITALQGTYENTAKLVVLPAQPTVSLLKGGDLYSRTYGA